MGKEVVEFDRRAKQDATGAARSSIVAGVGLTPSTCQDANLGCTATTVWEKMSGLAFRSCR